MRHGSCRCICSVWDKFTCCFICTIKWLTRNNISHQEVKMLKAMLLYWLPCVYEATFRWTTTISIWDHLNHYLTSSRLVSLVFSSQCWLCDVYYRLSYLFGERGWYEYNIHHSDGQSSNKVTCKLEIKRSPDYPYMREYLFISSYSSD